MGRRRRALRRGHGRRVLGVDVHVVRRPRRTPGLGEAPRRRGSSGRRPRRARGPARDRPRAPGGERPRRVTEQGGVPGPWSERLPHFRSSFTPSTGAEIQAEYLLPASSAVDALQALRPLRSLFAPLLIAAEVRTVAPDTAWIAPSSGRQSVGIHFTFRRDADAVAAAVLRIEEALAPFDARPHWARSRQRVPSGCTRSTRGWTRSLRWRGTSTPRGSSGTSSWRASCPDRRTAR
ncbi:D-arabinono-1,4-lactone oxidase [Curtobacterium flaccumfaciens]|nr:D-arabinono-1,4-lactone oxidase [Curtobacterium flaccumfaciens]